MALGTLPPTQETWGHWPHQQHVAAEYSMMDAGMVSYDCRTGATAAAPRQELTQHFVPGPFGPAPLPSPASPQYQTPVSYGAYSPYTPSPLMDAPFKTRASLEPPQPRLVVGGPPAPAAGYGPEREQGLHFMERSISPDIKSEARSSISEPSSPSANGVVPNIRVQGAPVYQFNTAIDRLAREIETNLSSILNPQEKEEAGLADEGTEGKATPQGGKPKRKRFRCDIQGCSKMFAQKNNLDTHRRAHTGESPYVCRICLHRFTQSVNLKSHIRRHFNERPYKCPHCPKAFSQPSNVKAHMKTHERRELRARWVCRFGTCKKSFTAKGNLKSHQNTYHVEAIEAFHAKLAAIEDKSMISEEDKEMARYISDVHNLANKGIKGRGKGRKVKRLILQPPHQQHQHQHQAPSTAALLSITTSQTTTAAAVQANSGYSMPLLPHAGPQLHHHHAAPPPQQHHHHQHGMPYYAGNNTAGLPNPAAYGGMTRTSSHGMLFNGIGLGINTRDIHPVHGGGGFGGILDSDQISDASSAHSPPPPVMMYEDHGHHQHGHGHGHGHGRQLAFGERLY